MECTFIDHELSSITELGLIHTRLASNPPVGFSDGVLLHTCHRVEWYANDGSPVPIAQLRMGQKLTGRASIISRLANIAAGTKSVIPGDRLVLEQVRGVVSNATPGPEIGQTFDYALSLAVQARRLFQVRPDVDYEDVLRTVRESKSVEASSELIIFGGGMLARAVARAAVNDYPRIIMVTRNPRRLRNSITKIAGYHSGNIEVVAATLVQANTPAKVDVAIATLSKRSSYLENIISFVSSRRVGILLDFGSIPVIESNGSNHIHVAGAQFLDQLAAMNVRAASRARRAAEWIEEECQSLNDNSILIGS